jgi:hypothetical protein
MPRLRSSTTAGGHAHVRLRTVRGGPRRLSHGPGPHSRLPNHDRTLRCSDLTTDEPDNRFPHSYGPEIQNRDDGFPKGRGEAGMGLPKGRGAPRDRNSIALSHVPNAVSESRITARSDVPHYRDILHFDQFSLASVCGPSATPARPRCFPLRR